jgi:hypothetical protein
MIDATASPVNVGSATRTLLPQHRADLQRSGLDPDALLAAGLVYSVTDGVEVARLLNWKGGGERLGPCLAFRYVGPDGGALTWKAGKDKTPRAYIRLKPDRPRPRKEDASKPVKYESPIGSVNFPFLPPSTRRDVLDDPTRQLLLTEGEKKSAAADARGFPCVGLVGVYGWQQARTKDKKGKKSGERKLVPLLDAVAWQRREVLIVFDSDAVTNHNVPWAEWHLAKALEARGAKVKVVRLPSGLPGKGGTPAKVGLDDYLLANGADTFRQLLSKAAPAKQPEDQRPAVLLGIEEHRAVGEAVAALAEGDPELYQRGGQMVRVVRPSSPEREARLRRSGCLRVEAVPNADLRIRLTRAARCIVRVKTKSGTKERRVRPAKWLIEGVASLGTWEGVRHLEAVTEFPVLRPDGSILDTPGYDRTTGLLYQPSVSFPVCPSAPTIDDAKRACEQLLEPFCDFPFAQPFHRSACLAAVLTPVGRHAYDGPSPWNVIDANTRGAGKGLLADTMAQIVTARDFGRMTYSRDSDEMGKTITALALAGEPMVLVDNLTGLVGNAALDAALTAVEWQGRILGKSQQPRVPLRTVWYATGNNVTFRADTARRGLHIRIETPDERPEDREVFRHPNLLAWVRENRPRLLCAALTILAAFCRAGKPRQPLKPWGSFEGWTELIRGALVWVGQEDPGKARMTLVDGADRDAEALRGLLDGWRELNPHGNGLTVAQALTMLDEPEAKKQGDYPTMRGVLADIFDLPTGRLPSSGQLGHRLRSYSGRVCGGSYFSRTNAGGGVARWTVRQVEKPSGGGDGGDGGDDPPTPYARGEKNGECDGRGNHPHHPHHPHPPHRGGGQGIYSGEQAREADELQF